MTKRQTGIITALSLASLILLLMVSQRVYFRMDLTRNRSNTISEASRNLYAEIPDQVEITYYVTERLSKIHPLPGEIEDLLREYAAYSRGRIRLSVKDPAKAGLVRELEDLGIVSEPLEIVEQDQASVAAVYSAIIIEYLDTIAVLPRVFSLNTLEYDLTARIRSLIRGDERELGIILGDPAKVWEQDFSYLDQFLAQSGYRIRQILPGDEIPDGLPALFVIGGAEDMDLWALYRIDRYIQGGGKVLFALESVYVNSLDSSGVRLLMDQGLLAMVSFYGATIRPELALDQAALTITYQSPDASGSLQYKRAFYPLWLAVLERYASGEHPATAGLDGVDLYWASPLELYLPQGVGAEVLFSTTPEAWLMTKDFAIDPGAGSLLTLEADATRGSKILSVSLSGRFPSWFEGVPKPVREGSSETLPDMPARSAESRIIVMGDADFASNMIQYTQSQRNLDFLLQAADWLGNDNDITLIRNRGTGTGRLDRITDPEARLRAMSFARFLNVACIPLAVAASGLFRLFKRRRTAGKAG